MKLYGILKFQVTTCTLDTYWGSRKISLYGNLSWLEFPQCSGNQQSTCISFVVSAWTSKYNCVIWSYSSVKQEQTIMTRKKFQLMSLLMLVSLCKSVPSSKSSNVTTTADAEITKKTCVTISGPSSGQKCVFPFYFSGKTFNCYRRNIVFFT